MTRITLCLIARDEAAFLPGCLDSVKGCADATVVVDTGSSDGTVDVAERAGATIIHHTWNDDFSAARNAALAAVDEGFVLVLDADERLAPGAGDVLRAEVERDEIDWGLLPLYDATSLDASAADVLSGRSCQSTPVLLGRLLRRTPDLRWESTVHEHVTSWALSHPRCKQLEAPILHYGEVPSVRAAKRKSARNLRLLERLCLREPENAFAAGYLSQQLVKAGDTERALEMAERAWRGVERGRRDRGPAPDAVLAATTLGELYRAGGRFDRARCILEQAIRWSGDHPNLSYLLGCTFEERWIAQGSRDSHTSDLRKAERHFERAIECGQSAFAIPTLPGVTSWVAWTRLGTIHLLRDRSDAALRAFDRALAVRPEHTEARLGRVEALLGSGRTIDAQQELEPLFADDLADGWILAAEVARRASAVDGVMPMVRQAVHSAREGRIVARHRLDVLKSIVTREAARTASD